MIHLYLLSGKKVQQHLTVDGWLESQSHPNLSEPQLTGTHLQYSFCSLCHGTGVDPVQEGELTRICRRCQGATYETVSVAPHIGGYRDVATTLDIIGKPWIECFKITPEYKNLPAEIQHQALDGLKQWCYEEEQRINAEDPVKTNNKIKFIC
jgi:hypothetical protein